MKKTSWDFSRTLSIKFDIDTEISYEDFCRNKQYQDQIEIIDAHFVLPDGYRYIRNYLCVWLPLAMQLNLGMDMVRIHSNFIKLLGDLLEFDINENFKNVSKKKIKNIQKIVDKQKDPYEVDVIDLIQTLLVAGDGVDAAPLVNELIIGITLKDKEALNNAMIELIDSYYSITKIPNKRMYYAIFQILIQKEHMFFLYDWRKDMVICSADNLKKHITWASIIYDLTAFLYDSIPSDIQGNVLYLKGEYHSTSSIEAYFKEIVEQFETIKNIEISVLSKEFNTDKRGEIDKILPNADIWFKKHKWQKQYIKVERKFKLKKP